MKGSYVHGLYDRDQDARRMPYAPNRVLQKKVAVVVPLSSGSHPQRGMSPSDTKLRP
jgi:hypothetical protein